MLSLARQPKKMKRTMPKYNYYCKECEEYFELKHSMVDIVEFCVECESNSFTRIPCIPSYITKINKPKESKAGSLVEEYIKKNKEAVKEEKQRLKSKEYKP